MVDLIIASSAAPNGSLDCKGCCLCSVLPSFCEYPTLECKEGLITFNNHEMIMELQVSQALVFNWNSTLGSSPFFNSDPSCRICSHHEEDINHILRHCNLAKEVWANLLSPQQASTFFGLPLRTWISSNIEPGGSNPKDWPLVFTTTVWWLWKWRNHRCFEDLTYKPREPTRFIIARAKEYTKILEAKDPTSLQVESIPRDEVLIRWEFPPDL